jgi:hypothetical protein
MSPQEDLTSEEQQDLNLEEQKGCKEMENEQS